MHSFTSSGLLCLLQGLSLVCASTNALVERASASAAPTPLSVGPSQNWDGNDGPWSSFTFRVGTPVQNVRLFVSTAISNTWVVVPGGCPNDDGSCTNDRGLAFNPNRSSTWSQYGYYQLGAGQNLNLSGEAVFGNDTLGLGIQGSGGPTLQDQIIGAFATDEIYLGMFGLNPASTNITQEEQGKASYMTTLRNQNLIPSLTFGYTAGNQYRLKQVLGSLTLGGYDASRFIPNNLTIGFAPQEDRELLVGIQSIKSTDQNGTTSVLLSAGITSLVDSTVAQIWLPLEACQAFEKAFGLMFDEDSELYLVNDDLHTQLVAQNASVTFTLGSTASEGDGVDIILPYDSFDLLVEPPTPNVANSTRYFPLRRAANETQYTLGRTFLQEAYLIVDWERRNFSISQCRFSVNSQQDLVAIVPSNDSMESGSSTGRTVGIAVGVVVAVVVIAVTIGVFFFLRWRNRRRNENYTATKIDEDSNDQIRQGFKGELSTGLDNQRFEMAGSDPKGVQAEHDAAPSGWVDEKGRYPGDRSGIAEVAGGDVSISELPSQSPARQPLHEMYDPSAQPVELPAAEIGELQGSTPAVSSRNSIVSSPRSANRSPFDKQGPSLMNRLSGRRSSNHEPLPGPGPPDRTAPKPSEGPRTPKRTGTANTAVISPVSKEGTTSPDDTRQPSQGLNEIISPVSSDDSAEASRRFWQRIMGK